MGHKNRNKNEIRAYIKGTRFAFSYVNDDFKEDIKISANHIMFEAWKPLKQVFISYSSQNIVLS